MKSKCSSLLLTLYKNSADFLKQLIHFFFQRKYFKIFRLSLLSYSRKYSQSMAYAMHVQNRLLHTLRLSSFQDIPFTFQPERPQEFLAMLQQLCLAWGWVLISSMELQWEAFYCSRPPLRLALLYLSACSPVLCLTVFHALSKMWICYVQEAESSRRACSVSFLHCLYPIVFLLTIYPVSIPGNKDSSFWHLESFPISLENNFNRTQLSKPVMGCIFLYWLLIKPINHRYTHRLFFAKKFLK